MKYIIKNKVISISGASTVKDECGNDLFIVQGRVFSFTQMKTICAPDRRPLYKVRNKFFHLFLPKVFIMDADENILLTIKKKHLFSFRQTFEIIPAEGHPCNIEITGDFIGRHYDIVDNGIPVAHVRRNFNLIQDSFWLETDLTDNAPFYIAIVIALDNFYDKARND